MPYSVVHFELAKKRKKIFITPQDLDDFLVGSLLVDISYILTNNGVPLSRTQTHYHVGEEYQKADFSENFFQTEYRKNKNYLLLGYYYHLLVDAVWRDSSYIQVLEKNPELEHIYQLSRKYYGSQDITKMLECSRTRKLISRLYNYNFEHKKLPEILQKVSPQVLKESFCELLDYMVGKKVFYKPSERQQGYRLEGNTYIIYDVMLLKQLRKMYPKTKYNSLKNEALEVFDKKILRLVQSLES